MKADKIGHTKKAIIEALYNSLGVVTTACEKVGIARSTFYEYCSADPDFKAAVDGIEDVAIDFVESQNYKLIKEGNPAATIFYLKTKGRKRGYTESLDIRQEVTQKLEDMTDEDIENQIKRLERIRNATKE